MSVKFPPLDPAQAALASDYERARLEPRGVSWADLTCRWMADLVRSEGHLVCGGWGYRWDRAAGAIERYPTAVTARVGVEVMPKRVVHSEVYPRGFRP